MAVIDCFLFCSEFDLLEVRLSILDPHVDKFVLVEATETFSGLPKPLYYEENKERFSKWAHKIEHRIVDGFTEEEWKQARANPATGGLDHWCREFMQRERLKPNAQDDDIVFICDVDEVWDADKVPSNLPEPLRLKLDVYTYWLNNRSDEEFWGPFVAKFGDIKGRRLNDVKNTCVKSFDAMGWHFTSMGGADALKKKVESYGHQEFNTDEIKSNIEHAISTGKDFIGRDFRYTIDEENWPKFLEETRDRYQHLIK